jgi:hypothetical protein
MAFGRLPEVKPLLSCRIAHMISHGFHATIGPTPGTAMKRRQSSSRRSVHTSSARSSVCSDHSAARARSTDSVSAASGASPPVSSRIRASKPPVRPRSASPRTL